MASRVGFFAAQRTCIAAAAFLLPLAAFAGEGLVRRTELFAAKVPGSLVVSAPARIGGVVYFPGRDPVDTGLWASDGSGPRAALFRGLNAQTPVERDGQAFFLGSRSTTAELWTTDGTSEGTVPVASVGDGYGAFGLTLAGDRLYLIGGDNQPWASDGTAQGTVRLSDAGQLRAVYSSFIQNGDRVFFLALGADWRFGLWATGGTAPSTQLVADLGPVGDAQRLAYGLTRGSSRLFFFTREDPTGFLYRLWVSDGTASGTRIVREFPGTFGRFCGPCFGIGPDALEWNGLDLLFLADDGIHGRELWRSDGSTAGTTLIADIFPGEDSGPVPSFNDPRFFGGLGLYALLAANDGVHGTELWRTDGTAAGTLLVADLAPGPDDSYPASFAAFGGAAFFTAAEAIWRTDGTASGTMRIRQGRADLWAIDGGFAAVAADGLFTSDGATFTPVDDLARPRGLGPLGLTSYGGGVFFSRLDFDNALHDLWRFDLVSGARVIRRFHSLTASTSAAGLVYFGANDSVHGMEPWISDGTEAGTRLLRDIAVPTPDYLGAFDSDPGSFTAAAGRVFFTAWEGVHGFELWTTDGTEAGTHLVEDFEPGSYGSVPDELTPFAGELAFTIYFPVSGLWRSNGNEAGTAPIAEVGAQNLVAAGGRLFFWSTDAAAGAELWASDGTPEGTRLVRDLTPGPDSSILYGFVPTGSRVFFQAYAADGSDLWTSDGTEAGTRNLGNFRWLQSLTAANGGVYFAADDREHGIELWWSDGSPEGTRLVRDIAPGAAPSDPAELAVVNGRLLFAADDGDHGAEPWTSDATAAGTSLLADVSPGPYSSRPGEFRQSSGTVYFRASDEEAGAQLWSMPVSAVGPRPGQRLRPTRVVTRP